MAESSDALLAIDFTDQIVALTVQAQENSNRLMALEEENTTLRRENRTLQERLSAVEVTPQSSLLTTNATALHTRPGGFI